MMLCTRRLRMFGSVTGNIAPLAGSSGPGPVVVGTHTFKLGLDEDMSNGNPPGMSLVFSEVWD